jgi:uncharacterized protein (TIGR03435 family)
MAAGCALISACALSAQAPAVLKPAPDSHAAAAQAPAPAQGAAGASAALPSWDVSAVKPSDPNARQSMLWFVPDGVKIVNLPLVMAVRWGFDLQDDRIFGLPGWAKTARFDIEAKVSPEEAPKLKEMKLDQRREMLLSLLQDRFGLKYHHEGRELPLYDLVVAKGGVKMTASKPDAPGSEGHGQRMLMMGHGHLESKGTGTADLARALSQELGRTVVDKTGLTGNFDYKLDWTPDDAPSAMTTVASAAPGDSAAAPDTAGPSLFTAVQEQLGLKLEATKGPVDVVVIDQLNQPTAN